MHKPEQPLANMQSLDQAELLNLIPNLFHRIVVHYGLWFTEVRHQLGTQRAHEILGDAFNKSFGLQMKRLGQALGFEVEDGLPKALKQMPKEDLLKLVDALCKNWLANDGIWFQAVEFKHGMNDAKRCNDSCWAHFSPFEAWSIKQLLGMDEKPGLEGLAKALHFRVYGRLNIQSVITKDDKTLEFQMNECRVQVARKRKGLDDYPCKSVGLVEYGYFARSIDPRIKTECIGCPPDKHPDEWYCAWRFTI